MRKQFFLFRFIAKLFSGIKKLAEKFITPSVEVVEFISRIVNSDAMPFINAIIPGHIDDVITNKIREHLPKVLQVLRISDECIKLENPSEIVECAIKKLRTYDDEGRKVQYHNIAALLSVYISDRKIKWREALHLAEEIYQQRKESRNEAIAANATAINI